MKYLLHILWTFAVLAVPAGTTWAYSEPTLPLDRSLVFADLNGDNHADAISMDLCGATRASVRYAIRFQVSGSASETTMFVDVNRRGLELIPRDVDGDHDLDLVVASLATHEALRVLVNNGTGAFVSADATEFPGALWHEAGQVAADGDRPDAPVLDEDGQFDDAAACARPLDFTLDWTERLTCAALHSAVIQPLRCRGSRAPPRS